MLLARIIVDFRPMQDLTTTQVTIIDPERQSQLGRAGILTVLQGPNVGAIMTLPREVNVLGRDPEVEVPIEDDSISRRHARISLRDGNYEIEDIGSTNGTYVAGGLVSGRVRLLDGVRVQLGHTIFRFGLQDEVEQAASKRIYEMSVRDGLTGVYNRRYFDDRLASEFAFAARHKTPLCVILADIDHFKRINDVHGHLAGDFVLKELARIVQARIRRDEVFARYGGEEFAIILPETSLEGAGALAETLRGKVAEHLFVFQADSIRVTISIGGAILQDADRSANDLIKRADEKLYVAKNGGRNRVAT
jgi:diguanylate cyclase (GGDEF)-like protein